MEKIVILLGAIVIILLAVIFYVFQWIKLYKNEIIRFLSDSEKKEPVKNESPVPPPVQVLERETRLTNALPVIGKNRHDQQPGQKPEIPEKEDLSIDSENDERETVDLDAEALPVTEEPYPIPQGGISMRQFDALISDQAEISLEEKESVKIALGELRQTEIFARIIEKFPHFESRIEKLLLDNDGENNESHP